MKCDDVNYGDVQAPPAVCPDEKVWLVVYTTSNYIHTGPWTRQQASDFIRQWWELREAAYNQSTDKQYTEEECRTAHQHLEHGTLAWNYSICEGSGQTLASAAVAWSHVIGMKIQEIVEAGPGVALAKAAEKMAKAMEKEAGHGDEWKGEGE